MIPNQQYAGYLAKTLPLAIILDLDNVLWDSTMLDQYLPKGKPTREQWREFEKHYPEVIPSQWAIDLVNFYRSNGHIILFVTSREDADNCKGTTIASLDKALNGNLENVFLFMRELGDRDDSDIVKERIYLTKIKDNFDVRLAVDDDPKNCIMFAKYDIPTLQKILKKEENENK